VVEHPGLFLGQDDNPSRSVGEPLEHALVLLTCRAPMNWRGQRTGIGDARAVTLSPLTASAGPSRPLETFRNVDLANFARSAAVPPPERVRVQRNPADPQAVDNSVHACG
jgi:hypothetical protein